MAFNVIIICFIITVLINLVILITSKYHESITQDSDLLGIQKYHTNPTPRIGGVALFLSFLIISFSSFNFLHLDYARYAFILLITSIPVFIIGLIEDLYKNVSPKLRLFGIFISAPIAVYITHVCWPMQYSDFYGFTSFLTAHHLFSLMLTVFYLIGICNIYNIIDGYNGLSSTTGLFNFIGLFIIAHFVHDMNIEFVALIMIGSILGFLVFNYPHGKIFLGDGGAYFIGFIMGVSCIYLHRIHHTEMTAFSVFLINMYPVTEMLISIIRRKIIHKTKSTAPDNKHLHHLIFHKLVPATIKNKNACVMPLMLVMIIPQVILGIMFYNNAIICLKLMAAYLILYIVIYIILAQMKDINP